MNKNTKIESKQLAINKINLKGKDKFSFGVLDDFTVLYLSISAALLHSKLIFITNQLLAMCG